MVGVGRGALTTRARAELRRHWGFVALLVLAAGLRAVVFAAYQPTLIFPDSVRYLQYAQHFAAGRWTPDGLRQSGYSVLIIPAVLLHNLWLISLVQHLVGLATGVLVVGGQRARGRGAGGRGRRRGCARARSHREDDRGGRPDRPDRPVHGQASRPLTCISS